MIKRQKKMSKERNDEFLALESDGTMLIPWKEILEDEAQRPKKPDVVVTSDNRIYTVTPITQGLHIRRVK